MSNKPRGIIKEKFTGIAGSISGITSVLGSWQICHNLCLVVITVLSIIGITLIGMPLMFLETIALPFWIIAFVLLMITITIYIKNKCILKN
jgi:hypothetical protein